MIQEPITLMLVDDHPIVRSGFCRLLQGQKNFQVVAEASDGEAGCNLYQKFKPDILILDLSLPGITGIETISRIKDQDEAARILIFSMHDNKTMLSNALKAGALGYITKSSGINVLVEAITQIKAGKLYIGADLLANKASDPVVTGLQNNPLSMLTERESQIFKLLAEGNSCRQIADRIAISPKTVSVHHTNIMKKLDLHNPVQLIHLAIKNNIIPIA